MGFQECHTYIEDLIGLVAAYRKRNCKCPLELPINVKKIKTPTKQQTQTFPLQSSYNLTSITMPTLIDIIVLSCKYLSIEKGNHPLCTEVTSYEHKCP